MSNIRKSQSRLDPALLKKLNADIWEFRTQFNGINTGCWLFGTRQTIGTH